MKLAILKFQLAIVFILLFIVFKEWFMPVLIAGGDFPNADVLTMSHFEHFPYAWDWSMRGGLGGFTAPFLLSIIIVKIPTFLLWKAFGFSWITIERILYLLPLLALELYSFYKFFTKLLPNKQNFFLIGWIIYALNTYILLVIGGGQIFIGLAYAVAPLVLLRFIEKINEERFSVLSAYMASLTLAIQVVFDMRFAFMTIFAIGIYWFIVQLVNFKLKQAITSFFSVFILPGILVILMHALWILPTVIVHENPIQNLGSAYSSTNAATFFSFARIENTIALLHPLWPENIFGKVGFMKPEFFLLPILSFSSLLFLRKKHKNGINDNKLIVIIFFTLLGLIGSFLAKGATDPFGNIYLWIFAHIPGFQLFRDPTKWYLLIALSYSILIPYTFAKIFGLIQIKYKNNNTFVSVLYIGLAALSILLLVWKAFLGQLGGLYKEHNVPQGYMNLNSFLVSQPSFYRTLWLPTIQRYGYFSADHPAIPAKDFFNTYDNKKIATEFKSIANEEAMQEAGIKYIIIPYDSEKELYILDNKYNQEEYISMQHSLDNIKWIRSFANFEGNIVYEVPFSKDHIWSTNNKMSIQYKNINPTKYYVNIKNAKKGDLIIFSENYDKLWQANIDTVSISSLPYHNKYNSFILPKDGDYSVIINYLPQLWVNIGLVISTISFIVVILSIGALSKKRKAGKI